MQINYLQLIGLVVVARVLFQVFAEDNVHYHPATNSEQLYVDGLSSRMRGLANAEKLALGVHANEYLVSGKPYAGGRHIPYRRGATSF